MPQLNILEAYYNATATHNYIFGVAYKGRVYTYFVSLDLDGYAVMFNEKPTTASRQTVIKYRSTATKRAWLESHATKVIDFISEENLKASCRTKINRHGKAYIENCGDCLEWLLAVYFGVNQNEKSNLKHTEGGDLVIDGVPYQVKYEKGAITVSL
jgi:hypothetical protein